MFSDDNPLTPDEPRDASEPKPEAPEVKSEEQRAKSEESAVLRSVIRAAHPSRSTKKRKPALLAVVMIVLGGLAAGAYLYRDVLRGTKLGDLIGLEATTKAKEVYYCPMHPNYKSDKPGDCPICNMTLVKLEPAAEAAGQGKHASMSMGKPSGERKILYWQDPMHPAYKSDKPGKAPDCGMDLVPVYADESPTAENLPPGTVQISPQKQQLIGVQYGEVLYQPLSKTIRTVGRVAYDETKVAHIHTKVTGYIEEVFVDYVGKVVKKGDPLFTIYSPDLVATQEEYLLALRGQEYLGNSPFDNVSRGSKSLLEATRKRLLLWDITGEEIETLEKEGKAKRALTIYSPVSGIVTERAAYHHGRYVNPEMDLYMIVDLSTVWIIGEVYEYELPFVKVGQTAEIEFPYSSDKKSLRGMITFIYPYLDPKTRTAQIRMEFPNPDFALKPDMFVNVKLKINLGEQLVVPEEAVLDSGTEQIVFVAHEGGYFEPRKVQLGAKVDNRYIILSGLKPREKIVTSGNFLVDSESRLKSAMSAMAGMEHGGTETPKQQKTPSGQQPPSGHQH